MIDAHVHVFAKVSREFPREAHDIMPADREENVENLLQTMDTYDINQATLVQIGGKSLKTHAYLRHCLKSYPNKFKGIGLVPNPQHPEDHMDRLAEDGSVVGFRLHEIGGPKDPLSPIDVRTFRTYPVWKHAAERNYIVWLYPRASEAHLCAWLLDAFPELTVVFNHLMICPATGSLTHDRKGRPRMPHAYKGDTPPTKHNTLGLNQYPNVCISLSGQYAFSEEPYPYRDLQSWHEMLLEYFGADRCMWATDFPWIQEDPGYGKLTHVLDELLPDISAKDRNLIKGQTAREIERRESKNNLRT